MKSRQEDLNIDDNFVIWDYFNTHKQEKSSTL